MEVMNAALRILPKKYRRSVRWSRQLSGSGPGLLKERGSLPVTLKRLAEKVRSGRIFHAGTRVAKTWLARLSGRDYYKTYIQRPTIGEMNIADPSKAIRSAEILPLLRAYFEIIEIKEYGGTILQFLLTDIAGNFDPDSKEDMRMLGLLCQIEDVLIDSGDLSSDFAFVVARKPITATEKHD